MQSEGKERYRTIGEVSELLGVETHTLRHWEKEFKDFVRPGRNGRRVRIYSPEDIETLRAIQNLLTIELYTTAGARRQMYLRRARNSA